MLMPTEYLCNMPFPTLVTEGQECMLFPAYSVRDVTPPFFFKSKILRPNDVVDLTMWINTF